jgi:hypothetical protein
VSAVITEHVHPLVGRLEKMWMPASEEEILAAIEAGYLIENVGCTGTKRLPFGISLKASNMLNGLQKMGKMCPTHTPHRGGCREQKPPDSLPPRRS